MKKFLKICAAASCAAAVVAIVIVTGITKKSESEYTRNTIVMGTAASFTVYGQHGDRLIDDMVKLEEELDSHVISWRDDSSELAVLNSSYEPQIGCPVSRELADVVSRTIKISAENDYLLDITIRPLARLWGIEDGKTEIPSQEDIDSALEKTDMSGVSCTVPKDAEAQCYITIKYPDMSLDLGAVGKGYGCDKAAEYLDNAGAAAACVALGGSILVYGSKPDGLPWKVGVRDPRGDTGQTMGVISISGGDTVFVSTSGDYEKYFVKDGKRYHHILDPVTGYPSSTHIIAATVVCGNGLLSDALSTLCMLTDKDTAIETVEKYGAEAILIDDGKNVYVSEGLKDCFTLTGKEYNIENR